MDSRCFICVFCLGWRLKLLGACFTLHVECQVIRFTRFGVCTGHLESTEWLVADDRCCTATVEVQVADMKVAACLFDMVTVLRDDNTCTCQTMSVAFAYSMA